jgi:hypothetical protein
LFHRIKEFINNVIPLFHFLNPSWGFFLYKNFYSYSMVFRAIRDYTVGQRELGHGKSEMTDDQVRNSLSHQFAGKQSLKGHTTRSPEAKSAWPSVSRCVVVFFLYFRDRKLIYSTDYGLDNAAVSPSFIISRW